MIITKHFEPNIKGRDFVMGDLHGCLKEFYAKFDQIGFDITKDRMFSVGDLIDRGPDSMDCLELINQPWFFANRGNHEDMMLSCTLGTGIEKVRGSVWIDNGGLWATIEDISKSFLGKVDDLPLVSIVHKPNGTRVNIVHAEFVWECTDKMIDEEDFDTLSQLIWGRNRYYGRNQPQEIFVTADQGLSKTFVGHSPVKTPTILGSYHYIDTGCVYGGPLTIVEL